MRLSIVLASGALLGVAGCKVDAPVTPIDYLTPPACPADTDCYTVDQATCAVTVKASCTESLTANQVGPCQGNKQLCTTGGDCFGYPTNYRPSPEVCDDLDNDCSASADEGCDVDDDQHCVSTMLVVRPSIVCPRSIASRGDDCGDTDPNNWRSCATCVDGDGDTYHAEDGCDAFVTITRDCDDANPDVWAACATCADADGDGAFVGCDAYTLHPPGPDCDDADARRSPAFTEVCFNTLDDDCDGLVDEACPPVAASIARSLADLTLHPGGASSLAIGYHEAQAGSRPSLHVSVAPTSGCDAAGVTASIGGSSGSTLDLHAGTSPTLSGCTYHVVIADGDGFVFDGVDVAVVDDAPLILRVDRATYNGTSGRWRVAAADGIATTLTVHVTDPDSPTAALGATWKGTGVTSTGQVDASGVTTATLTVTGAAGTTQTASVQVGDGARFSEQVVIEVVVEPCVYVSQTVAGRSDAAGFGDAPATPMATMAAAAARAWSEGKDLCIVGGGTYDPIVLSPTSHPGAARSPSIRGGFLDPGSGSTSVPVPLFAGSTLAVVAIGPGYQGSLTGLKISGTGNATNAVLAQATGAGGVSLLIADTELSLTPSSGAGEAQALDVVAAVTGSTIEVTMSGGKIGASTSTVALVGARVSGAGASLKLLGLEAVDVSGAASSLRAVVARNGAALAVQQVKSIDASSTSPTSSVAVGVDVVKETASDAAPTRIVVTGNGDLRASCAADLAAGIRLNQASDVTIADNDVIAVDGAAPHTIGAAITDIGAGFTSGLPNPGSSSTVRIRGNRAIVNLAKTAGCTGPLVAAGILLAGTTNPAVADNGRAASALGYGGIVGGAAVASGTAPAPVGLWLINTAGAQVTGNEIRAGYFDAGCSPTGGGAGAWLAFGYRETTSGPTAATTGALVDRNGILCAPPVQATASPTPTGCSALYVDSPANGPLITNNVAGGTYGDPLVGLSVRGGSKTRAFNNAFDVGDDASGSGQGVRWAVHVDRVAAAGLDLADNLLVVRGNGGTGALAYHEVVEGTTATSKLASLQHNLMFIVGDVVSTPDTPAYALVTTLGNAASVSYPASKVDLIDGVVARKGNFVADPLLITPADASRRSRERLSPYSPARHAGIVVTGVPGIDLDGEVRAGAGTLTTGPAPVVITGPNPPGVVDVGPDEYLP